jgi:plastocyanin
VLLVAAPAAADQQEVTIDNFQSRPATVTIRVGDSVRWTNEDSLNHTVTFDDGSFDRELGKGGGTTTRQFDSPGDFSYVCRFHGHGGRVIVQEVVPSTTAPPPTATTAPPAAPTTSAPSTPSTATPASPTTSTPETTPSSVDAASTTTTIGSPSTTNRPSTTSTARPRREDTAAAAGEDDADGGSGAGALLIGILVTGAAATGGLFAWRRRRGSV